MSLEWRLTVRVVIASDTATGLETQSRPALRPLPPGLIRREALWSAAVPPAAFSLGRTTSPDDSHALPQSASAPDALQDASRGHRPQLAPDSAPKTSAPSVKSVAQTVFPSFKCRDALPPVGGTGRSPPRAIPLFPRPIPVTFSPPDFLLRNLQRRCLTY